MIIIYYWFICPSMHRLLIDADQQAGVSPIVCDQCDFDGYVDEGDVIDKYIARDEMAHLSG